jgi:hypothetical protein
MTKPLVFTRYLYSKEQVYHSLIIALLEKALDEALFWTYELYFSGFQEELYVFMECVYDMFYKSSNSPALKKCIEKFYEKWREDQEQHHLFGSMIRNLICRPYNVNEFMESFLDIKCLPYEPSIPEGKFMRVNMNPDDIKKYETVKEESGRGPFVLRNACRFPIRKNITNIFMCSRPDITEEYRMHWIFHCRNCPLWRERIDKYKGTINHEMRSVDFEDDDADAFYDLYYYDPDEQTQEVQERSIGTGSEKQMTLKEFATRYGGAMITKKIKPKHMSNKS